MSARKKTWVKSAFSQLANGENIVNNSNEPSPAVTPRPRRSTRKTPAPAITEAVEVIDVDNKDEKIPEHKEIRPKRQNSDAVIIPTNILTNENWIDVFAPTNSDELAVHAKKLKELQQWFQHCDLMRKKKLPAQLCLITGPSGSGKTAAVHVLAKQMAYSIQEWINPVDQEIVYNLGDQVYGESNFTSSQAEAFKGFLFKASRYRSLLDMNSGQKRLLMIEDFPNFLLRDSSQFEDLLSNYLMYGKSPLIFIVTDAKKRGLNISYNLFTDQLKQKFLIEHISFNPVASTLMQAAMKRFCALMRLPPYSELYRPPSADLIDSIIVSAQGDIRNALINLHFSSLKGAPSLLIKPVDIQESSQGTKPSSRKRKAQSALKSVGRDESLTMMHALGRVFNPKYTDTKKLLHSPETIAEAFSTEPKKFIDFLHANYLQHFRDIEGVLEAINGLSLCDLILKEYREDSLALTGLNLGIRNLMVANENPVTGWMPVKGPKRLNLDAAIIPARVSNVLPPHHISKNLYALDYKTFVNVLAAGKG